MAQEDVKEIPESEVSPPKKKSLPMPILIAVVAVAVGAGGFFAGKVLGGKGGAAEPPASAAKAGEQPAPSEAKPADGHPAESGDPAGDSAAPGGEGGTVEAPAAAATEGKSAALSLDEFTVNLNDPFGKRYANVQISLEVAGREFVAKVKEDDLLLAKIRDVILLVISSKSFSEMNSVAGKITLKEEIMMRVNEILKGSLNAEPVKDVLFPKFLIQ